MRRRRKRRSVRFRLVAVVVVSSAVALAVWEAFVLRIGELRDPKSVRHLSVPDGSGGSRRLVLGPANPYWTPLRAVSKELVLCVLKSEDDRFYQHDGFDWAALRSAVEKNLERRRYARGGSTITMQLAKNLFLWREKSLLRKVLEAYLTWRLEGSLSKQRILELYLNAAEWGPGVYGVGEASRRYFGKPPSALTLGESALLAAILPNPVRWNPERAPETAMSRQRELLARLRRENALDRLAD
ncbi:MAG: monofunctional biosynthetic peptidoglycan transglycosylase [Candidatus Binatia bacterium]